MSEKWLNFIYGVHIELAVIFATFTQFFFMPKKTLKLFITVVLSTVFISIIIMPSLIEVLGIESPAMKRMLYGTSALLSMELLAIVLRLFPQIARSKIKEYLGVKDEDTKTD